MNSTQTSDSNGFVTIRLTDFKPGISPEDLVQPLQQLYSKKSRDELKGLLQRVPLVLSRKSTKEKAVKIKAFLEARGAIIDISESQAVGPPPDGRQSQKPETESPLVDRRRKPRIHKSMDLNPMGIGEILDKSIRLLKEHFWLFFVIILIPQAIYFLMSKAGQIFLTKGAVEAPSIGAGVGIGVSAVIAIIVFLVFQFWAQGALIFAVSERYMGHGASVRSAYGAIRSKLGRVLGTMILMVVLLGLLPTVAGIIMAIAIPALTALGTGKIFIGFIVFILVVLLVIIFIRMFLNWILVDKVVVLEDIGWMSALRRSKELMTTNPEEGFWKKTKMKASLIILIGVVIAFAIGFLIQLPGALFAFMLQGNLIVSTILEILNIMINAIVTVFTATAMILFYYDIRLRKEGFDLKMMAENL